MGGTSNIPCASSQRWQPTEKVATWLTSEIEQQVRKRAAPWVMSGVPVIEYFHPLPHANHRRAIERSLKNAADGTILIGALPAKSHVTGRFDGCMTVLHECVSENGPSVIVARKGFPKKRPYRFLVPGVWQVGDTYSMFNLFAALKKQYHDIEVFFEHDVSRIWPEAKCMPASEADKVAWDGVLVHSPTWGEIGSKVRWSAHFYEYPFEIAKRMGWLPQGWSAPELPPPFPILPVNEAFARENVPYERGTYVVIVELASWWPRDWSEDRSVRVAQWLDMHNIPTVLVGMNGKPPVVEGYTFKQCTNLIGKGSVGDVAAIIASARLVVSPDTGLLHIACGLRVPTIATFGPSEFKHVTKPPVVPVVRNDGGCIECYAQGKVHTACDGKPTCMDAIPTMKVIEAIADQLKLFPSNEWKKPRISLCMMVKNEMIMLPKAIETARPLVDEIIVVDTGSTDGTRQWLTEQPGVQVFDYDIGEAIQSFSDVRNFSISKAHCKYIVWMDACERFVDAANLRKLVEKEQYDVYAVPIVHANIRYVREKIAPREFCHFVDRVHEYIDVSGLRSGATAPALGVVRDYYRKQNRESSESRNIRLLQKQIEEAPESPRRARWLFYIARDLCDAKRFDEALPYLNQRVALEGFWEERYAAGVLLARALLYHSKDYVRADKTADALIALAKNLREGYYAKAECMYWQSRYIEATKMYKYLLSIPRPSNATFWLWEEVYTWLPHDRLARIAVLLGDVEGGRAEMQTAMGLAPAGEQFWMAAWLKESRNAPTQQPVAVS